MQNEKESLKQCQQSEATASQPLHLHVINQCWDRLHKCDYDYNYDYNMITYGNYDYDYMKNTMIMIMITITGL